MSLDKKRYDTYRILKWNRALNWSSTLEKTPSFTRIYSLFLQRHSLYTQATSKCGIQLGLETPFGEEWVEDNSYSIVKINYDG